MCAKEYSKQNKRTSLVFLWLQPTLTRPIHNGDCKVSLWILSTFIFQKMAPHPTSHMFSPGWPHQCPVTSVWSLIPLPLHPGGLVTASTHRIEGKWRCRTLSLILKCDVLACSVMSYSLWPHEPIAPQVPLSMGFSRQEYWSGLLFLPPRDLPDPGIQLGSPAVK